MRWLTQIQTELQRLQSNDNVVHSGTIARRVAGIALKKFYESGREDFGHLL